MGRWGAGYTAADTAGGEGTVILTGPQTEMSTASPRLGLFLGHSVPSR